MPAAIMGVLNVTPDSFSDGGHYFDRNRAIARGHEMVAEGADIIDVGGESTRPGAEPVTVAEERRRVVEVVAALVPHTRVSIDTRHPEVAEAAIEAGATLVNDVSASLWPVVASADRDVGWVAMHMRGEPRSMQVYPTYQDVVGEVGDFLVARAEGAKERGIDEVWIDPGIGFGKTPRHNLLLLRHLDRLVGTGFPVMVGTSRKTFLGRLIAEADAGHVSGVTNEGGSSDEPVPADRLEGSLATAMWAVHAGARMVRVHDVRATVDAVKVGSLPLEVN